MLDSPARLVIRANEAWWQPTSAITSIAAATICARLAKSVNVRFAGCCAAFVCMS